MIGQTILHYKVLEKLGEGGMGVVYKAHDTKLDRVVALKFLPHHLTANDAEQARFLQEAKAASALNHPNVCGIHSIGEHEGQGFIDMEYVDGVTLRTKIAGKLLTIADAMQYAIQTGDALHDAHSRGIIHRDVKCDNIMVNQRNQVKVMDFGLAKLKGSLKITRSSSTVGTLAYMAPEQLHGGDVDVRSDIFSFGIVLYEMLTGQTPFRGEHEAALMYSIVNENPQAPSRLRAEISPELDRIVQRSLEKDPEDRYQHIDDMVSELRRVQKQTSRVSRINVEAVSPQSTDNRANVPEPADAVRGISRSGSVPSRRRLVAAGAVVLIAALAAVYLLFLKPAAGFDSLAVLPFVNVNAEPNTEYLSDGITESIINSLSRIPQLRVVPRTTVFRFKGKEVDPQEIGGKLNVKSVLTGRVIRRGDELNVQLDLIDVEKQSQIWGNQYRRNISDVLALQDEIVNEITSRLRLTLATETKQRLAKRSTDNVEAYQLYLQAQFFWNKRDAKGIAAAIDYFTRALAIDPNYALAYVGLANSYAIQEQYAGLPGAETYPKAEAAARKALEIDNTIAEAHVTLGFVREYFWDWRGAEEEYRTAIALNPQYATAYHWYSILLRTLGRDAEAFETIEKARQADPMSLVIATNVGEAYLFRKDYAQALSKFNSILEIDSTFGIALDRVGKTYRRQDMLEKARLYYQKAVNASNRSAQFLADLGNCLARLGKKDEANEILKELMGRYEHRATAAFNIAIVYAGLGKTNEALDWLERDLADHSGWMIYFPMEDAFDGIRADPRFHGILKKIGLEKE
jgi:serine/threonine protein kinase/tetratricopeptide (TPR) repeat protein